MVAGDRADNPIWMAISGRKDPTLKEFITITALSILPVALAIIMQKPALRQAIKMHTFHMTKEVCQNIADSFQVLATKSAQAYQNAQL